MAKIIGIDLGTTNSVAAVMQGGEPVVVPDAATASHRLFLLAHDRIIEVVETGDVCHFSRAMHPLVKAAAMVERNGTDYAVYLNRVFGDDPDRLDGRRKDAVLRRDLSQRHPAFDDLHSARALLRTFSAGRAEPHLFIFYLRETEGGLPDDFADAEASDPVPRANRVAQSALIAVFEGISALLLDAICYFFVVGYILHGISQASNLFLTSGLRYP